MQTLNREAISQAIREARERAGFTQARLAEEVGIAEQSLSRLERGAYEPALSTAWAIARALGVTLNDLVSGKAEPQLVAADNNAGRRLANAGKELTPRAITLLSRFLAEVGKPPKAPKASKAAAPARKATKAAAAPRKAAAAKGRKSAKG